MPLTRPNTGQRQRPHHERRVVTPQRGRRDRRRQHRLGEQLPTRQHRGRQQQDRRPDPDDQRRPAGRDQVGEERVQLVEVPLRLGDLLLRGVGPVGQHALGDERPEAVPLAGGHTHQLADDGDRKREGQGSHHVDLALLGHSVEAVVDQGDPDIPQETQEQATGVGTDGETSVWEGRYSMRNFLGRLIIWGTLGVAWIAWAIYTWGYNHPDLQVLTAIAGKKEKKI